MRTLPFITLLGISLALASASACNRDKAASPSTEPFGAVTAATPATELPLGATPAWKHALEAWEPDEPIPDFALIDQEGGAFTLGDWGKDHLLIGFVFSRCQMPKACPLTMKKMREVQRLWAETDAGKRGAAKLRLLTVTLDPEFDRPRVLKAYGRGHGVAFSNWKLATGVPELVAEGLPSLFNVIAFPDPKVRLNHSVKVALLRPGLRELKEWRNNEFEPREVVELVLKSGRD